MVKAKVTQPSKKNKVYKPDTEIDIIAKEAAKMADVLTKESKKLSQKLLDILYSKNVDDNQFNITLNLINVIAIEGLPLYKKVTKISENVYEINFDKIKRSTLKTNIELNFVHFFEIIEQVSDETLKLLNKIRKMNEVFDFDKELDHKLNKYGQHLFLLHSKIQSLYDNIRRIL